MHQSIQHAMNLAVTSMQGQPMARSDPYHDGIQTGKNDANWPEIVLIKPWVVGFLGIALQIAGLRCSGCAILGYIDA
eukprot:456184-Pelagomonas_calceolata.AAC.1